ncbi:MAG: hypothetical protein MI748_20020 [Opitutales bacterium]|nr:hypothetical protein [Opitutales bacterium]
MKSKTSIVVRSFVLGTLLIFQSVQYSFAQENCGCDLSGKGYSVMHFPDDMPGHEIPGGIVDPDSEFAFPETERIETIDPSELEPLPGTGYFVPGQGYTFTPYPSGHDVWFVPYVNVSDRLAACERVRDAITWREGDGRVVPFKNWSDYQKQRLDALFQALWNGNPNLGVRRPDLKKALHRKRIYLTRLEAFDMFAVNVAHSLFLEATRQTRWRLGCYSEKDLEHIFSSDVYCTPIKPSDETDYPSHIKAGRDYQQSFATQNAPLIVYDPRAAFEFMSGKHANNKISLLGWDQEETLTFLTTFMHDYWNHGDNWGLHAGVDWKKTVFLADQLAPAPAKKKARMAYSGCHHFAGIFQALSRSVNIPLANVGTQEYKTYTGYYGNRSHRGLIYGVGSSDPRILWHVDEIYAVRPGPIFPIDSSSKQALLPNPGMRRFFEVKWAKASDLQKWGFVYSLEQVKPGIGWGSNDAKNYEDYYEFGWFGGYWKMSDRAQKLFKKPPVNMAEWDILKQYVGDLSGQWNLECYYQLGVWDFVKFACDAQYGESKMRQFVKDTTTGNRTGHTPPVVRPISDYWQRVNDCLNAHGGCQSAEKKNKDWEKGRQ